MYCCYFIYKLSVNLLNPEWFPLTTNGLLSTVAAEGLWCSYIK